MLSRRLARIDALPGHGSWVLPPLWLALFAWSYLVLSDAGLLPIGEVQPFLTASAFYAPSLLGAMAVITRV